MVPWEEGVPLQPQSSHALLEQLHRAVPEVHRLTSHLSLEVLCNLDSSDLTPGHWQTIAQKIQDQWNHQDGFVVIHGTDTLAYSASAVSFFLGKRSKPVVFTGSQLPLESLRTDAKANLLDAVQLATLPVPEVMVCFDAKIHRGSCTTKTSTEHLQAFTSPNGGQLGHVGIHLHLRPGLTTAVSSPETLDLRLEPNVRVWHATPGWSPHPLIWQEEVKHYKAFVIRAFGKGTLPLGNPDSLRQWERFLTHCQTHKIPILVTSQCSHGGVDLGAYKNGSLLQNWGVLSGNSMTFEASLTKLMVALGRQVSYESLASFLGESLVGELGESWT